MTVLLPMQVYKAMLDGSAEVAVKFLKADRSTSGPESISRRFEKEVSILRACTSSHIVSFIGAWTHQVGSLLTLPANN